MMSKLAAKMMEQTNSSGLRCFKANEEDKQEMSMTNAIIIKETIRRDIDQIVDIEESNLKVEQSTNKIIEVGQGMNKTTGMTIGQEILEVM